MALRPLYQSLWAETALPEDIGDADTYVPSNPSYPEATANQYNEGWYVSPGMVVKQPHQWWNSWYQSVDWQLMNSYQENYGWQPEFEYKEGSLAYKDSVRYIALRSNTGQSPEASPADWVPAKFYTYAEAQADYNARVTAVDGHILNKNNPHQVTYAQLDGMSQGQIDTAVAQVSNEAEEHIADENNPHELTPEQVRCLHKDTGGTFEGQVGILRVLLPGGEIRRLASGFEMMLDNGSRFGVDTAKSREQKDGLPMLKDSSYAEFRARNAHKFHVPIPDLHLPLSSWLNAYSAPVDSVIEYTSIEEVMYTDKTGAAQTAAVDEPAFSSGGLVLNSLAGQSLSAEGLAVDVAGTVFGIVDGVPWVFQGTLNKNNLLEYFTGTSLRDLRVWAITLTQYQLAALGDAI